jgi:nitroreductase
VSSPSGPGLLLRAVECALRAPSVHNTQPWRWQLTDDHASLYQDRDRRLHQTDPDRRDLLISCGAALHHLHVALAAFGAATRTDRLPDREDRDLLATVRPISGGTPDPDDALLFPAVAVRRTDRRRYRADPVGDAVLHRLGGRARAHGCRMDVVASAHRAAVDAILGEAADAQRDRPGYLAELMTWSRRYAGSHDGVPLSARPRRFAPGPVDPTRPFPPGTLVGPASLDDDGSTLLVLHTGSDDDASRLAAGEATSAVLLTATSAGLATAPLSQALELPRTRTALAREVLHDLGHPQMMIRVGHPPDSAALPETPRRPLWAVLQSSPA